MSACEELLEEPGRDSHLVQFYEADERILIRNLVRFFGEGLTKGDTLIAIATEPHRRSIEAALNDAGVDVAEPIRSHRLLFFDAEETLGRFMSNGHPDAEAFDRVVGNLVRESKEYAAGNLRAYGEMVGILWQRRQFPAAIRLEQLWHKLLKSIDFSLFCAYPIDVFDEQFEPGVVDALLCAHTHLLSAGRNGDIEQAVMRAMAELMPGAYGPSAIPQPRRTAWAAMPRGEAIILWLREHLPERASEILALARGYYHGDGALTEDFAF